MQYGLDIGPSALRIARPTEQGPVVDSESPLVFPLLTPESGGYDEDIHTVTVNNTVYAVGTDAKTVAADSGGDPEPLFTDGALRSEPYVDPALEALLEALVSGDSDAAENGASLCYTTVEPLIGADGVSETRDQERIGGALAPLEMETTALNKAFAVIYGGLKTENTTGLGICCEAETTSLSLAYYGVPVLSGSLEIGTNWLIDRAAEQSGASHSDVAAALESFHLDPDAVSSAVDRAIATATDELVGACIDTLEELTAADSLDRGVPVAIAVGGDSVIDGIGHLFGGRVDQSALGLSISGVTVADEPALAPVRGALSAAIDGIQSDETAVPSQAKTESEDGVEADFDDAFTSDITVSDEGLESFASELADVELEAESSTTQSSASGELESRIEGVEAALKTFDPEDVSLHADQLSTATAHRSALEDELETLEDALQTLRDELQGVAENSVGPAEFSEATETVREKLTAEIEAVESELTALESAVGTLEEELRGELGSLEETVGTVEAELREDVRTLAESVETVTQELERSREPGLLADRVADTEARLESIQTERESTVETVTAATDRLETLETSAAETESRLETVEHELQTANDRLASIPTDLGERSSESADAVSALDTRTETLESQLEELSNRLEEHQRPERIDSVDKETSEPEENALSARIDSLESELAAIKTKRDPSQAEVEQFEEALDEVAVTVDHLESAIERVERGLEGAVTPAELEDQVAQFVDQHSEPVDSNAGGVVGALLAGGSGAGLIVGGALVAAGTVPVGLGAIVVGILCGIGAWVTSDGM